MTAADIIVASVQANPPGGDVAVSPAVRVLVAEIVRLRGEIKAAKDAEFENLVANLQVLQTRAWEPCAAVYRHQIELLKAELEATKASPPPTSATGL